MQLKFFFLILKDIFLVCCCSVSKLHPTLCGPVDCRILGSSVLHCLQEFAQIHVHWVSDAILTISFSAIRSSFCLQSFPASGAFPLSWLFVSDGQSIGASASASVLPMNIQGLISFRIDWFDLLAAQETVKSLLQHDNSKASIVIPTQS